jgi:hypothetical protein
MSKNQNITNKAADVQQAVNPMSNPMVAGLMQLLQAAINPTTAGDVNYDYENRVLIAYKQELELVLRRVNAMISDNESQKRDAIKTGNVVKTNLQKMADAMGIDVKALGIDLTVTEIKTTHGTSNGNNAGGTTNTSARYQTSGKKLVIYVNDALTTYPTPGAVITNSSSGCNGSNAGRYTYSEFVKAYFDGDEAKFNAGDWNVELPNKKKLSGVVLDLDEKAGRVAPATMADVQAMIAANIDKTVDLTKTGDGDARNEAQA